MIPLLASSISHAPLHELLPPLVIPVAMWTGVMMHRNICSRGSWTFMTLGAVLVTIGPVLMFAMLIHFYVDGTYTGRYNRWTNGPLYLSLMRTWRTYEEWRTFTIGMALFALGFARQNMRGKDRLVELEQRRLELAEELEREQANASATPTTTTAP